MKSDFAVLFLLVGLLGCEAANEVTAPARPESIPHGRNGQARLPIRECPPSSFRGFATPPGGAAP